ncbi:hypothetical protein E2562_016891 [Oryza meyeriana var. granulata]|uniref:F-box domain-containing protein n=1 Tax=Oryza meyeriana var. granulata TaxID=110450 RepID=A0A6G1DYA3_9ORYZ|nr:hypothetical protein E2562_016891 [Oryza meyeriana var. granulata]
MADSPPWAGGPHRRRRARDREPPPLPVMARALRRGVCRSWRESLERLPVPARLPRPPPKLPYLILPLAEQPAFSCVLSGGATHPFFVPEWIHHACYLGRLSGPPGGSRNSYFPESKWPSGW